MKSSARVTLRDRVINPQGNPVALGVRDASAEVNELDLVRQLLNDAMDESGWKHEAIAAALCVHPTYLSKMRSGEKPWSLRHVTQLPDPIENIFKRKYAETTPGAIVVTPVSFDDARRQLATGLLSLLAPSPFPAKTDRVAKASLKGDPS